MNWNPFTVAAALCLISSSTLAVDTPTATGSNSNAKQEIALATDPTPDASSTAARGASSTQKECPSEKRTDLAKSSLDKVLDTASDLRNPVNGTGAEIAANLAGVGKSLQVLDNVAVVAIIGRWIKKQVDNAPVASSSPQPASSAPPAPQAAASAPPDVKVPSNERSRATC